ncbi:hypothetical protein CAEBREN_22752 [Caenorhabditis brenneri]|uniref:Uncharacterized protein n=1 Tax=Caenorhabditis brenneri TaxID=135651 RepID=G0P5D8_CAEBE|nr:hypothetical protein CAEBREN_22752 [Caenorhabditis brenneri]
MHLLRLKVVHKENEQTSIPTLGSQSGQVPLGQHCSEEY